MAKEEFTVRITRKGEVFVEIDPNLPARRIKDLVEYLEETLGPVKVIEVAEDPYASGQVELEEISEAREDDELHEKAPERIRLQDNT